MKLLVKNIIIFHLAGIVSIFGHFAIAKNTDPVSIKQLNFDLAPPAAAVKEIAEIKFDCTWTKNFCVKEDTEILLMH